MLKRYIAYLKDNPQGHWFKRRLYGWGWTPARWQGWLVLLIYVVALMLLSSRIDEDSPGREVVLTFLLPVGILTAFLITVCWKTGEKPRWQWGLKDKDDA
jgi:hypothetical protein